MQKIREEKGDEEMKARHALAVTVAVLVVVALMTAVWAQPRMKMTTDIPASITAPDKVETSIGTLRYFDGVPDEATVARVYDYLDRSRATEAFLNCIPVMSMYGIREGQRRFGIDSSNKIVIYDNLLDSKALWLTANTSTMYAMGWLDLKEDGPTVIELPPRMLGILDDMAFLYMTDLGMAGPDKGKGGKFLVLPPGYEGNVPDGYFVVPSNTYGVWLFMRGYLDKGIKAASDNIRDNLKVYPLAKKNSPPPMQFINGTGKEIQTVLPNDFSFFEGVHKVLQDEPAGFLGPEITGQLAAIGIEKGKPFPKDERMTKILVDAAAIGNAAARTISFSPRHPGLYTYGKDSGWYQPIIGGSTTYMENGARVLDGRVFYHFGYICVSPAMSSKSPGKGSDYSMGMVDSKGRPLDGSKTYKLRMPPNIPVKDFWALTMYDTQTRCQLQTDQQFPTLDSYKEGMKQNSDGSIDVYFSPKPPRGQESNWLQTIPGKAWFVALRMYGPLEPWLDQTWRPGEIELVEQ
jgi:hypothetical protein